MPQEMKSSLHKAAASPLWDRRLLRLLPHLLLLLLKLQLLPPLRPAAKQKQDKLPAPDKTAPALRQKLAAKAKKARPVLAQVMPTAPPELPLNQPATNPVRVMAMPLLQRRHLQVATSKRN
jgi:hypothetical protein